MTHYRITFFLDTGEGEYEGEFSNILTLTEAIEISKALESFEGIKDVTYDEEAD